MSKINGTVKFFNGDKGFGFIQPDDGGNDVFVHISSLQDSHLESIEKDAKVSFEKVEQKNGKFQAENIEITS